MLDRTANLLGALSLAVADRIETVAREVLSRAGETPAALVVIGYDTGPSNEQSSHPWPIASGIGASRRQAGRGRAGGATRGAGPSGDRALPDREGLQTSREPTRKPLVRDPSVDEFTQRARARLAGSPVRKDALVDREHGPGAVHRVPDVRRSGLQKLPIPADKPTRTCSPSRDRRFKKMTDELSASEARRMALAAQGFCGRRPERPAATHSRPRRASWPVSDRQRQRPDARPLFARLFPPRAV